MTQNMTRKPNLDFIDRRRSDFTKATGDSNQVGQTFFTCNATGTTSTAIGANAAPATETNVARVGDKFKLYTAAGVLKEEKVFRVTAVAVGASTTLTFTPLAATAPVSTDVLKLVGSDDYKDIESLDRRLNELNSTKYSTANLEAMTSNDKVYALRTLEDPASI